MQESRRDSAEEGGVARERGDPESRREFLRRGRRWWIRPCSRFAYSREPIAARSPQRKSRSNINVKPMGPACRVIANLIIQEKREKWTRTRGCGKSRREESFRRERVAAPREQEDRRAVGFLSFVVSRMARSHDSHTRAVCRVCVRAHTGARGTRGKDGGG